MAKYRFQVKFSYCKNVLPTNCDIRDNNLCTNHLSNTNQQHYTIEVFIQTL